jgi:hypothetical protein
VINSAILEPGWQAHFGYLKALGYAVCIGEFGGNMDWPNHAEVRMQTRYAYLTDKTCDQKWQNAFVNYLVKTCILDSIYWSINPESSDTYGIYTTPYDPVSNTGGWGTWSGTDSRKLTLIQQLWNATSCTSTTPVPGVTDPPGTITPDPTAVPGVTAAPTATPGPTAIPTATPAGGVTQDPTTPPGTVTDTPTTPPTVTNPPQTGCTCPNLCSSQTAISVPFTKDGAGEFCYTSSSLASYVNSWNCDSVNINGTNCTNTYVSSGSIAAIGGVYYIYYKGSYSWSHLEIK